MIARSASVKLASLAVAVGLHAAILVGLDAPAPVQMAGAGAAVEARLGTSFRDLAAGGVLSPVNPAQTEAVAAARPVTALQAVRPERETAEVGATGSASPASEAGAALPRQGDVAIAARARAESRAPVPPVGAERVAARTTTASASASHGVSHRSPVDALRAAPETSSAPSRSMRPSTRPEGAARVPPRATEAQSDAPPASAQAGTAAHSARAGATNGRASAPAASTGAGRATSDAGTAAARSYPGLVMRCISRAGRARITARGTAVVAFRISAQGRVTGATLAASSGHAALDRAAVRMIAGAGPCPAPPAGAQTAFSIRIEGR